VLDEDYLTLTTIHSAKGWSGIRCTCSTWWMAVSVGVCNRQGGVDRGRAAPVVRRADAGPNDLFLVAPLKFHLTNQSRHGDAHVYGGRSRFLTDKVLKTLEATTFQGSSLGTDVALQTNAESTLDITARMKEMW